MDRGKGQQNATIMRIQVKIDEEKVQERNVLVHTYIYIYIYMDRKSHKDDFGGLNVDETVDENGIKKIKGATIKKKLANIIEEKLLIQSTQ